MNHRCRLTSLAIEGYRCFRSKQSVRLAPLTFLVGGNSTGKTSFLAVLRAMWNVVINEEVPDFRKYPYDLGTFYDIVYTNGEDEPADSFAAELRFVTDWNSHQYYSTEVTFDERGGSPFPYTRRLSHDDTWIGIEQGQDEPSRVSFATRGNVWDYRLDLEPNIADRFNLFSFFLLCDILRVRGLLVPISDDQRHPSKDEFRSIRRLIREVYWNPMSKRSVFASAPVRSRPNRNYDPTRPSRDAEGQDVPTYLATVNYRNQEEWRTMKRRLETFGREMGLFDEISLRKLGRALGGPFQIQLKQVRESSQSATTRNLIDVGYGVSQILPVLTELLRHKSNPIFFFQQPEAHLHPSAQAALGSLFSAESSEKKQLIVETHSDYLINRVRMDIRDKKSQLQANDVSILFFESHGRDVEVHSIGIDNLGNIIGAPSSYRRFFLDETIREVSG